MPYFRNHTEAKGPLFQLYDSARRSESSQKPDRNRLSVEMLLSSKITYTASLMHVKTGFSVSAMIEGIQEIYKRHKGSHDQH